MKRVFYIGNFKPSKNDAESQLVLGNAMVLRDLGYDVTLIGNDRLTKGNLLDSRSLFYGFEVYSVSSAKRLSDLLVCGVAEKEVFDLLLRDKADVVIAYGSVGLAASLWRLARFCKAHDILFISNCVDLSSTQHGNPLERIAKTADRKVRYRVTSRMSDGIIAVSDYIKNFYSSRTSVPVVVIPPLRDVETYDEPGSTTGEIYRIIYAGIPFPVDGRKVDVSAYKDRLDLGLDYLLQLYRENYQFRLDIYGITEDEYFVVAKRHREFRDEFSAFVLFHGKVSQEVVRAKLREADYSLLLRSESEMTMAGFSSKLVDSVCAGVPVITTKTSDYERCLTEGVHCFFVSLSEKGLNRIKYLIGSDKRDSDELRKSCYASKIFDYRNYYGVMRHFIDDMNNDSDLV